MEEPIKNGGNGLRDDTGRFIPGHPFIEGAGRPKKTDYQRAYEDLLFDLVSIEEKPIIKKLIDKAKMGDMSAIKEINDRILGKSKQPVEIAGNADLPFKIIIEPPHAK